MIIKCLQLFSDCNNVRVTLKNEVLNQYDYLQGDYQISTPVNGEPSWKNGAYAIWSIIPSSITKIIGPLNRIGEGEDSAFILANYADGLINPYNSWKFWNGNTQIHLYDKDIQFTCNGKYSKHLHCKYFVCSFYRHLPVNQIHK